MRYRAKVTNVANWVKLWTKKEKQYFVKDSYNTYYECETEDEAKLLEEINQRAQVVYLMEKEWIEKYGMK